MILPGDLEWRDAFGADVAIDGCSILVGSASDRNGPGGSGSAYVFGLDPAFEERVKLLPDDYFWVSGLGSSVALHGQTALVGAPSEGRSGAATGAVHVFAGSEGVWVEEAVLLGEDAEDGDHFGGSVAMQGDLALVGAWAHPGSSVEPTGAAYFFSRDGTAWIQKQKLVPADPDGPRNSGYSVALDGDVAVAGAWTHADGVYEAGAAYVYARDGGSWALQARLTAPQPAYRATFGFSVAVSGARIAVGEPNAAVAGGLGAVYLYTWDGAHWILEQKVTSTDPLYGDRFGMSVALHGDRLVVGSPDGDFADEVSGASAHLFYRGSAGWEERLRYVPSTATVGEYASQFGRNVALGERWAVVGDAGSSAGAPDGGAVFLFEAVSPIAEEQLERLVEDVAGLSLGHVIRSSLLRKLSRVFDLLEAGDERAFESAAKVLRSFIREVEGYANSPHLDGAEAGRLTRAATDLIELLGGSAGGPSAGRVGSRRLSPIVQPDRGPDPPDLPRIDEPR